MSTEPCWAMNNNGAVEADDAADSEGLSWFMGLLRQMMTEVMAGEAPALQKANAIARLGNLYLRAHRTAELAQANKALRRQAAALEERLAAAEAQLAALAQQPVPASSPPAPEAEAGLLAAGPVADRVPVRAGNEVSAINSAPAAGAGASWDMQRMSEAPPCGG